MTQSVSGFCFFLMAMQWLCVAHAGDGFWMNPRGGTWAAAENWGSGLIASEADRSAGFASIDLIGDGIVTLDGTRTLGGLVFGDTKPSHDWYLRAGSGGGIILDVADGAPVIQVENRAATVGVPLAGDDGLVKRGAGTLVLTGGNFYAGPTIVSSGTLRLGPPPAFPGGLRVMPLGDSITYGYNGSNAGYRGPLYDLLRSLAPAFQYIGTSMLFPCHLPVEPLDQRRHEGHSSFSLQDVNNNLDGFDNSRFLQYGGAARNPNGGFWFTGENGTGRAPMYPDVVLMMLGTNDLDNLPEVETRLRTLIEKITRQRPAARLLVAKITPLANYPDVQTYNQIVGLVAADFQMAGFKVSLVDMNTNFPLDGLDPDGVHPNDTGFRWMAIQWHESLIRTYSPERGLTTGIPANSPVTVGRSAILDLHGNHASTGEISVAGKLDLGKGGELTTPSLEIRATGGLAGSGVVHGRVIHNGGGIGVAGESVMFTGAVTNNGMIKPESGAALHFGGIFINNGTFSTGTRCLLVFSGDISNNGVYRLTGDVSPSFGGAFINNGTLDLGAGLLALPDNLVNNGLVLDSSEVQTHSFTVEGNTVHLTILAGGGRVYQLQYSPSLAAGSWENLGAPQTGAPGMLLSFIAKSELPSPRGFYRIRVTR